MTPQYVRSARWSSLLLAFFTTTTLAAEPHSPQHGFLVFTTSGVANYALEAKGGLHFQSKISTGRIDEFVTADGRIYQLNMLLGRITELNADFKPLHEASVKSQRDVPYWLGVWDRGLLVLTDNTVVYLDADLKEVARLQLEPRRHGEVAPALNPKDFDVFEHRGYLLANTGEIFIVPLDSPQSSEPLHAALGSEDRFSPDAQWIDPADHTLNLIGKTERTEYDPKLKPGESRVIKEQIVFSYNMQDLSAPALRDVVHEERKIHMPEHFNFDDGERDGRIIERMPPPYRSEGKNKGTYIGILSKTTPAYAEAFEEKADQPISQFNIVRLKSRGRYEKPELFREIKDGPLWFKDETGIRYIESDMMEHMLRLQPVPYGKLHALPEMREAYFNTLAY